MKSSGSSSASGGAGKSPGDGGAGEKKAEKHEYVSLMDLMRKEAEAEDSSESDGGEKSEPRVTVPRIFPSSFLTHMRKPNHDGVHEELVATQFRLLAEKRLCSANLRKNRLPFTGSRTQLLLPTAGEDAALSAGDGISVEVIEPDGQTVNSSLTLKRRLRVPALKKPDRFILGGAWSDVVARHADALQRGRLVRIWWLRRRDEVVGERLWLALDVVDDRAGDCELASKMSEKWHFGTTTGSSSS